MSLQLHRPDGRGGIERRTVRDGDWRSQLRSPRWGKSLRGGRLPKLANPEMNPTPTGISVAFWVNRSTQHHALFDYFPNRRPSRVPSFTNTNAPRATAKPVMPSPMMNGLGATSSRCTSR